MSDHNGDGVDPRVLSEQLQDVAEHGPEMGALRLRVLRAVSGALIGASDRVERSRSEPVFRSPEDVSATLGAIKLLPMLLPLLREQDAPQAPQSSAPPSQQQQVGGLANGSATPYPECLACGAPPGQHWAHECPKIPRLATDQCIFDYRTRTIYERRFLGHPAQQLRIRRTEQGWLDWLAHNRLTREQYAQHTSARKLREQAAAFAENARTLGVCAQRTNDINAQVVANIAGSMAKDIVALLDAIPEPGATIAPTSP